jgi:hypothetical protein
MALHGMRPPTMRNARRSPPCLSAPSRTQRRRRAVAAHAAAPGTSGVIVAVGFDEEEMAEVQQHTIELLGVALLQGSPAVLSATVRQLEESQGEPRKAGVCLTNACRDARGHQLGRGPAAAAHA